MKFSLSGVERVEYDNREGRHVSGYRLHFVNQEKIDNKRGTGYAVQQEFISDEVFDKSDDLVVGKCFDVYYNRYGRVDIIKTTDL